MLERAAAVASPTSSTMWRYGRRRIEGNEGYVSTCVVHQRTDTDQRKLTPYRALALQSVFLPAMARAHPFVMYRKQAGRLMIEIRDATPLVAADGGRQR